MTRIVCHAGRTGVPELPDGYIHVWLYGPSPPYTHVGTVGAQAMDAASRLMLRPSLAAMDLLSIAMAVTAADTFVLRADAPDGWGRSFDIVLPLADPVPWEAVRPALEATLRFLSSDKWHFEFVAGGPVPPADSVIRNRNRVVDLSKVDCVSLFSGGLDSAIGALDLQDAVIDGEIVALDEKGRSSFQLLQGFDMGQERPPIVFYAFDLLRLNGKDLRNLRIEERKAKLEELLTTGRMGDQIVLYLFFAAFSPKWPATEIRWLLSA